MASPLPSPAPPSVSFYITIYVEHRLLPVSFSLGEHTLYKEVLNFLLVSNLNPHCLCEPLRKLEKWTRENNRSQWSTLDYCVFHLAQSMAHLITLCYSSLTLNDCSSLITVFANLFCAIFLRFLEILKGSFDILGNRLILFLDFLGSCSHCDQRRLQEDFTLKFL